MFLTREKLTGNRRADGHMQAIKQPAANQLSGQYQQQPEG
jgi:hypothetical protein